MKSSKSFSDILQQLRDSKTKWERKIKLAHKLISNGSYLHNKLQFLSDWSCQEIINCTQKSLNSQEIVPELFQILAEVLTLASKKHDEHHCLVTLRPGLIEAFTRAFNEEKFHCLSLIECCCLVFANPNLCSPLIAKFEKYVNFLASSLVCLNQKLEHTISLTKEENHITDMYLCELANLISILIHLYGRLQRQQSSLIKVFTSLCGKLLEQLALLRYLTRELEVVLDDKCSEVTNPCVSKQLCTSTRETLKSIMWNSALLEDLKKHLDSQTGDVNDDTMIEKRKSKNSCFESLLLVISTRLQNPISHQRISSAVLDFVPDIFLAFLEANRSQKILQTKYEFTVFRKLCSTVLQSPCSSARDNDPAISFIRCVDKLLKQILAYGVFKINDETVNSENNREFLKSIGNLVLSNVNSCHGSLTLEKFQCLQCLLDIDSSLLEPQLPEIVKCLLPIDSPECKEDDETGTLKAKILDSLLLRYGKTRQMEKFLRLLTQAVEDVTNTQNMPILLAYFLNRLKEIADALPTGQIILAMEIPLDQMCSYAEAIAKFAKNPEADSADSDVECFRKKFEIFSTVFQILTLSVHVASHEGHQEMNQLKFLNILKRFKEDAINPMINFCPSVMRDRQFEREFHKLVWKLLINFQRMELFFLQHGIVRNTQMDFYFQKENIWPSSIWSNASYTEEDAESRYLKTISTVLHMKLLMLDTAKLTSQECLTYLQSTVTWFLDSHCHQGSYKKEELKVFTMNFINEMIKQLPWLGPLLQYSSMLDLSKLFLMQHHTVLDPSQPSSALDNKSPSGNFLTNLLSTPCFYDNCKMQKSLCYTVAKNTVQHLDLDSETHLSYTVQKVIDSETIHELVSIADDEDMDIATEGDRQNVDTNSFIGSDCLSLVSKKEKNSFSSVWKSFILALLEDSSCNGTDELSVQFYTNSLIYLEVTNLMCCQWLLPECRMKLLAINLLMLKKLICNSKDCVQKWKLLSQTFVALSKFAKFTMSTHDTFWTVIDPATILYFILIQLDRLKGQCHLPKKEICEAIECLSTQLLESKRSKAENSELEKLATKICQICKDSIKNPTVLCLSVIISVLRVAFNTARRAQGVKNSSAAVLKSLFVPVAQLLLSDEFSPNDIVFNSQEATEKLDLLKFHSISYALAVLISINLSRRYSHLTSHKMDLDVEIQKVLDVSLNLLTQLCEVSEWTQFCSFKAETALEILHLLYSCIVIRHDSVLNDTDLACQLFSKLLTLAKKCYNRQTGNVKPSRCYEIMNDILKGFSGENFETLLDQPFKYLESNLEEATSVAVSLNFFGRCLGLKWEKDEKRSFKNVLRKLLYITLKLSVTTSQQGNSIMFLLYDTLVKILNFSKGLMHHSHCTVVLHSFCSPMKDKRLDISEFDVYMTKVELLSVILFSYADVVYTAISPYISAVKSLLTELGVLHKAFQSISTSNNAEQMVWKTSLIRSCEKLSRLYREIASHKTVISKYAAYLVAGYLKTLTTFSIAEEFQNHLTAGIYCLMDTCTSYEFSMLNMALGQGERELFRILHKEYNMHHKFQGKA